MIPFASREQIQELDALLVERFDRPLSELVELAGLRLAQFLRDEFPQGHRILFFCGHGHNGADGLVATQHLQGFGFEPVVILLPGEYKELTAQYIERADAAGVPMYDLEEYQEKLMINKFDVVVDCLIGHGLSGPVRGAVKIGVLEINEAHEYNVPVVCCDVPSGMDCDEGPVYEPHVIPSYTISMAFPRKGLVGQGVLFVADMDVPEDAYPLIGLPKGDYFSNAPFIRL